MLPCFVPWLSSDCPADGRMWVPFQDKCYHFVHGEEDQLKKYTFERAKTLCQGFGTRNNLFWDTFHRQNDSWNVISVHLWPCWRTFLHSFFFLELLSIQSAEENDFVIKYSPEVWRNTVNVWLGMYYDTSSKYHVTSGLWQTCHEMKSDSPIHSPSKGRDNPSFFFELFGGNRIRNWHLIHL